MVGVGLLDGSYASGSSDVLLRNVRRSFCARENEEFARWNVGPCGQREPEVLVEDFPLWSLSVYNRQV
jgi:hypothetical protein